MQGTERDRAATDAVTHPGTPAAGGAPVATMRVAFDIGGTFTDVIMLTESGEVVPAKVLSLIDTLGDTIAGLVNETGSAVDQFVHGTTLASNMVIEGTGARTALVTTPGYRDILDLRGERRPNIYDPTWERLPALIPRRLCVEVTGRMLSSGAVDRQLDGEQARTVLRELIEGERIEALAICLVNAYVNPEHERELAAIAESIAPDLPVCSSADLNPEINEYERASTTAINASLVPGVRHYLDRLAASISGLGDKLLIMRSNGGIMSVDTARDYPVYMIESGPAAGALAAARLARESGLDRALAFDMGGTTAKACLIEGGVPLEKPGGEIGRGITSATRLFGGGGYAVRVPSLDIVEVGAGGGSIAWVDDGGALRVGPRSAGADPGPACYGRGGTLPTVTDANVVLGYINPTAIAGDRLRLDRDAAVAAIQEHIATPLHLDVHAAAYGICQVVNATMMRALRAVSTERGRDPREFSLIAFGGAGALHAADLADFLSMPEIRVPLFSGLFSSLGLLFADFRHDYVRSIARRLDEMSPADLETIFADVTGAAHADMAREGVAADDVIAERHAEVRYVGQASEVLVPLPDGISGAEMIDRLPGLFDAAHAATFGYRTEAPVELVSLRLRATTRQSGSQLADLAARVAATAQPGAMSQRTAYFGPAHGHRTVRVLDRWGLSGEEAGPLIIEEPDTTVVVPPGWTVSRDGSATLVMRRLPAGDDNDTERN
jgi:N-methylhydantoinase A